ncbi:putative MFS family arabinose efflux permease [Arthrobacter sp. 1088]|uniref:MFS transporter n=1 Tax=Arthrobacter sp. 1088 TaxID=2817768 RepID=UPI0028599872|nr:MFS transporter [Arthrobacter sp. 1088]MDR6685299.1 putative MFS family arabinose efflux permease [Arthrobacter sp. 1088]
MTSSVKPDPSGQQAVRVSTDSFPLYGLLALSAAIFISMATEFLPGGLIPQIAADFDRSPGEVGHLITVFALTVIVTAAPVALLTRRVQRKALILVAFALIGLGNIATVLAPSFEFLLAARVLGALAHGAFWSVVAAYPAHLVRPTQLGKATALTAAGGSVAGVLGIPLGNALGQAFGWRVSFGVLAALVVVTGMLMAWKLPSVAIRGAKPSSGTTSAVRRDPTLPAILIVCVLITLVVAAQNSFGTFNVVWLLDLAHVAPPAVPIMLFVGGVASAVGVALTGILYNKFPIRLFLGSIAVLVGLFFTLPAVVGSEPSVWLLSGLMGAVFGGVPVMLQTRMMMSASPGMRNVAAALQTTAFNVGIGGGAFMGGVVIDHLSLDVLPFWAATLMFVALVTAGIWQIYIRRRLHNASPQEKEADHGVYG